MLVPFLNLTVETKKKKIGWTPLQGMLKKKNSSEFPRDLSLTSLINQCRRYFEHRSVVNEMSSWMSSYCHGGGGISLNIASTTLDPASTLSDPLVTVIDHLLLRFYGGVSLSEPHTVHLNEKSV